MKTDDAARAALTGLAIDSGAPIIALVVMDKEGHYSYFAYGSRGAHQILAREIHKRLPAAVDAAMTAVEMGMAVLKAKKA